LRECLAKLAQIAHALGSVRYLADAEEYGEQNGSYDGQCGNHDQQFYQRESESGTKKDGRCLVPPQYPSPSVAKRFPIGIGC